MAEPVARGDKLKRTDSTLAPRIRFQRRSLENGLPQINVTSVAQDANGFIWMGTQDGLVRFDGVRFKVYRNDATDPTSIANSFVVSLATDRDGNLWIGTGGSGLDRFDAKTQQFTHHRAAEKTLGDDTVLVVRYLADNALWVGTNNGGLSRLDPTTGRAVLLSTAQGLSSATVRDIAQSKDGRVWIATSEGLDVFDPTTKKLTSVTAANAPAALQGISITAVAVDRDQTVWMGTEEGLFRYDPAKHTFTAYNQEQGELSDNEVSAILVDSKGWLWVGTQSALHRRDPATQRFVRYLADASDPRSLPTPPVTALFEDSTANIWVGTLLGGVGWFSPLSLDFGYYKTLVASGITQDSAGNLWLGTPEQLCKYAQKAEDLVGFCYETRWGWALGLVIDSGGDLWVATTKQGVYRVSESNDSVRHYTALDPEAALTSDAAFAIIEDRNKQIWVGTFGGGLLQWNRDTDSFTRYPVPSDYIYVIREDPSKKGVLWIGTADAGLVRLDTSAKTVTKFTNDLKNPASISYNSVTSIYFASPEVMWIGTYGGGVNRFDMAKGEFRAITTRNGLPADSVLDLIGDGSGRVWVGTTLGLATIAAENTVTQYSLDDGLGSIAWGLGQAYRLKDGKVVFGGSDGFNIFRPEAIKPDSASPNAKITRIAVLGEDLKTSDPPWAISELRLGYRDSLVSIDFATPYFAAPDLVHYEYTLDGLYNKWISLESPTVSLTNLEGGDYVFRLKSQNPHGVWNETAAVLKVHKDLPPWRRPWAYAIYAAIMLALVFWGFRYQRSRVRRVEREGRLAIVEQDLALTGAVQSGFLPETNEIHTNRVQVYGFYRAANACSGDWWWYERLADGRHVILVGDVTGHGPGPAMVTAAVATAFRVQVKFGLDDVKQSLALLNEEVLAVAKGRYHMTLAVFELDETRARWVFHSAGAPPMLSIGPTVKHKVHFCPGHPLGTEGAFETGMVEGALSGGQRIILYTDGIPEIVRPDGTILGMRWFAKLYERTRTQDLKGAAATLVAQADENQAGAHQADDWTFAMIEWSG